MDRRQALLQDITKDQVGVEIGPWCNPLVPKKAGYRSLVLDVFDREQLGAKLRSTPNVPDERISDIEDVDLVGSVSNIAALVDRKGLTGKIDYVISSHNFEHIP